VNRWAWIYVFRGAQTGTIAGLARRRSKRYNLLTVSYRLKVK
jgi:hypothetical protein